LKESVQETGNMTRRNIPKNENLQKELDEVYRPMHVFVIRRLVRLSQGRAESSEWEVENLFWEIKELLKWMGEEVEHSSVVLLSKMELDGTEGTLSWLSYICERGIVMVEFFSIAIVGDAGMLDVENSRSLCYFARCTRYSTDLISCIDIVSGKFN
jgi:hypothetical protein